MERIIIGKILSPHGVKGEVKVLPLTDYPKRFYQANRVWVDKKESYLEIEKVRKQQELFLIKFHGIEDRNQSELITNSYLTIDPEQVMELPPGHFYHFQMIGLETYDIQGNYLGELTEIMETGANDIYVVKRKNKRDLLIPAIKIFIKEIDIKEKRMMVELPEGLDE